MGKQYTAKPEDKFTFGLWTVGNRGRDPFGDATRPRQRRLPRLRVRPKRRDRAQLAAKKLPYERLDQLTLDILLGVR